MKSNQPLIRPLHEAYLKAKRVSRDYCSDGEPGGHAAGLRSAAAAYLLITGRMPFAGMVDNSPSDRIVEYAEYSTFA